MKAFYNYILPAVALLLPACQREEMQLEPMMEGEEVPAFVEDVRTRVSVDGASGACAWEAGDMVAVCVNRGGANRYLASSVKNGTVFINMVLGDTRTGYAVYPESSVPSSPSASDYTTPTVVYPATYDLTGKDPGTYSPAPMVADNTAETLDFFHAGAVLQLVLQNVPSGTTGFEVTFDGMDHVTGTYTVSNPGTASASVSYSSNGGNVITFDNVTTTLMMTLNIPLPTQDYSDLTSVSVTTTGLETNWTATAPVSAWGTPSRGEGKKLVADFVSITHLEGYTGAIRGYYVSPGILKWDDTLNNGNGGYTLTEGVDQMDELLYYGKSASLNVYWHQWRSNTASAENPYCLKYRMDGVYEWSDIRNREVPVDGRLWWLPSKSEYDAIIGNSSGTTTLNGDPVRYCGVVVNLAGSPYAGKGQSRADGDWSGSNTNYQSGFFVFPDNTSVTVPGLIANNGEYSACPSISYSAYKKLTDAGAVFFLHVGYYSSSWSDFYGYYWTSSRFGVGAYYLNVNHGGFGTWRMDGRFYCAARLIRQ